MNRSANDDLEKVVKSNPAWIKLWARTKLTPATAPGTGFVADSVHAAMSLDPALLSEAYREAWRAGRQGEHTALAMRAPDEVVPPRKISDEDAMDQIAKLVLNVNYDMENMCHQLAEIVERTGRTS